MIHQHCEKRRRRGQKETARRQAQGRRPQTGTPRGQDGHDRRQRSRPARRSAKRPCRPSRPQPLRSPHPRHPSLSRRQKARSQTLAESDSFAKGRWAGMAHNQSRGQFRLRHLLLSVLALSVLFAAIRGSMLGKGALMMGASIGAVLFGLCVYFRLSSQGRRRARIWTTVVSTLIGISPFFGASAYAFVFPGASEPLPEVRVFPVSVLFRPFYVFGELVLLSIDWILSLCLGPAYIRIIIFSGEGPVAVRPIAVCMFWLGVAAVLASTFLIGQCRVRWGRSGPDHLQSEESRALERRDSGRSSSESC